MSCNGKIIKKKKDRRVISEEIEVVKRIEFYFFHSNRMEEYRR